jgi:phosphoglycolate phosphatase-like HAD superfamily hydrolase
MDYDFYIFDCDGVILDSNSIKSNAFAKALEGDPQALILELISYHLKNGGISRYEKFDYYYNVINPSKNPKKDIKNALKRFGDYVFVELLKCNLIPGILDYLEELKKKGSFCFVNSGSDEAELNKIFKDRGIDHFFRKIKGSPSSKNANNQAILKDLDVNMRGVFFGDSNLDYKTAKEFNLDFIFISGVSEWKNPSGNFVEQSEDFNKLLKK